MFLRPHWLLVPVFHYQLNVSLARSDATPTSQFNNLSTKSSIRSRHESNLQLLVLSNLLCLLLAVTVITNVSLGVQLRAKLLVIFCVIQFVLLSLALVFSGIFTWVSSGCSPRSSVSSIIPPWVQSLIFEIIGVGNSIHVGLILNIFCLPEHELLHLCPILCSSYVANKKVRYYLHSGGNQLPLPWDIHKCYIPLERHR